MSLNVCMNIHLKILQGMASFRGINAEFLRHTRSQCLINLTKDYT